MGWACLLLPQRPSPSGIAQAITCVGEALPKAEPHLHHTPLMVSTDAAHTGPPLTSATLSKPGDLKFPPTILLVPTFRNIFQRQTI